MKSKKRAFIEKIINILLNVLIVIFGIILLVSMYTGIQTKILGNDHTDFFGYSIFEVQTGSMADTINAGDWIVVKLTSKVKLNDIVTYKLKKEYITHRIVQVYNGTYITQGDANNAKDDEPVDQKQIVGKVIKILPSFGILRKTLFNPSVLIALIITLFIFHFTFKKNKNVKEEKAEKDEIVDVLIKKVMVLFNKIKKLIASIKNKNKKANKTLSEVKKEEIPKDDKIDNVNIDEDDSFNNEDEDHYKDEDELDKTSFYRVVPVDADEVEDKYKNAPTKAEVEEYYKDEDELDKTSLYRIIPVDADEVDNTLLEVAKNEIKVADQNDKEKKSELKPEPEKNEITVEESETLTQLNLELLKSIKGSKKSKNVIDTAMLIKEDELNKIIDILTKDDKTYVKKATVKKTFLDAYINAKYYNYFEDKKIEQSNEKLTLKIEKTIKEVGSDIFKNYQINSAEYNDIVDIYAKYAAIFILIANFEQASGSITDTKAKNEFYKKEVRKYANDWDAEKIEGIISRIMKIQRDYNDAVKYFLEKLETNTFNLIYNKLSNKKNMYGLELEHNITFSKVYSDYIIDKTYNEGIIAEDKMEVLLTLLSIQLIKDMFLSNFNKKYILYVPNSLYTKKKKLEKLLKLIDNKYAKDNVIILVTFDDLINNKRIIEEVRKTGYKFAIVFDKDPVINNQGRGIMYVADYIFVDKKTINIERLLPFIPKDLLDNIIYENIVDKVGDFGGEDE